MILLNENNNNFKELVNEEKEKYKKLKESYDNLNQENQILKKKIKI